MNSKSSTFRDTLEQTYGVKFPDLPKLLIWAIGLATAIALTLNDFVPLIKEYRDNNMALQVQVVLLDDHFKPPHMVLALPNSKIRNKFGDDLMMMAMSLHRNDGRCGNESVEICEELKRAPWGISSDLLQDFDYTSLETVYNNLTLAIVEKLLINIDFMIFPDVQYPLSGVLMSSMVNYLEWIAVMDYYLSAIRVVRTDSFTQLYSFTLHPSPDFEQKFENYNNKLDLLANQTFRLLCTRIKYTELEYLDVFRDPVVSNRTCTDLLLHSDFPVSLDDLSLWIPLSAAEGQKMKEYRFASFPEKGQALINSSGNVSSTALVYGDTGILYQLAVDPVYSTYVFEAPFEKEKRGQRIIVRYKVQMRARETRLTKDLCSNETSVINCLAQCTKLWIIEQCDCFPFSLRIGLAQPGMNYCTSNLYAKCNISELPKEVTDACMTKCQRPCGYTVFSWQISYESCEPLESDVNEFILKLVPMLDTFAEFTWSVKDTPEQFFSQLAAVGSFYLGFSGLSLFAVVIWLMDWWKRYKKLRMGRAERMPDMEGQGVNNGWMIMDSSMECCRCDGRKSCRIDKQWLAQIEMKLRRKWLSDMENMMKEKMSPGEEASQHLD